MVTYTTAPGDVEMGLDVRTVDLVEKKSSTGWIWKMFGALLIVALCLGGVFFAFYWTGRPELMTESGAKTEALTGTQTAEKTDTQYPLKTFSSTAKAAIHLEGSYDEVGTNPSLEWRNDQGQAFSQGDFKLVKNEIYIPQTGLYFVYSQASFRVSCSDGDDDGAGKHFTPLSHRIWRYSDSIGGKASLMSAVRSACQNTAQENSIEDGQGWYHAIYLGAMFHLNKGDKLWTETNQVSQLETDEGKTFFGVFGL
ncbi:tumor necrosis factor b (TNF superfamily, member 2) [Mastacembelus armatus]|uniref:Tumor necrosis factor n=1 Tax=Mastacembelus armatus TaxID=205130 RepID=A0A3Q3S0E6_9TELE|nr:tumor necrosis factor-like [Mastacembelus armatus]